MARRHIKQPDGSWAEKPPVVETRPLWTITKGANSIQFRGTEIKNAVRSAVSDAHKVNTVYPYTITVQRVYEAPDPIAGEDLPEPIVYPVHTVEVSAIPQEPIFQLSIL